MQVSLPPPSERAVELHGRLTDFMREHVLPAEAAHEEFVRGQGYGPGDLRRPADPILDDLKRAARERGLWNLFLPAESGLTQLEYAGIAELTGWSLELAPEALNCAAPDTGNMELLHLVGTPEQKQRWLEPLLAGEIRSAFGMTEPAVASSDATNIETAISRDGDELVISGRKWFSSGAADARCELFIVMGKTDPEAAPHRQQTMVIVPRDTPGVTVVRDVPVFGHYDQHGHAVVDFDDVRVPAGNVLGEVGGGFAAAQARLGPGRIHHVMRALGAGERALALLVRRAKERVAFGRPLAEQGALRERIAESRIALDAGRALCHQAAAVVDAEGNKAARHLIAEAKVFVPRAVCDVIDRAIQVHGGMGVTDDVPLARMWGWHRSMRLFDGPDEVHLSTLARAELGREPVLPA